EGRGTVADELSSGSTRQLKVLPRTVQVSELRPFVSDVLAAALCPSGIQLTAAADRTRHVPILLVQVQGLLPQLDPASLPVQHVHPCVDHSLDGPGQSGGRGFDLLCTRGGEVED